MWIDCAGNSDNSTIYELRGFGRERKESLMSRSHSKTRAVERAESSLGSVITGRRVRASRNIGARRHQTTGQLHNESGDIEKHKDQSDPPGSETKDSIFDEEEMNHSAEDHVHERVDPKWSKQNEQELSSVNSRCSLIGDVVGTNPIASSLPDPGHDEDPAEGFAVLDGLKDVGNGCEAEDDGEDDCSCE